MKRVIHPILGGNRSWRAVLSVSLAGASLIAGRGLGGSGGTATLVVPPAYENVDAVNGSSWMQLQMRLQQAYGAPQFPGYPIVIREIRWRPSARYGQAFSATISNFQVNLSTTGRTPTGLSSVLANNVGPDDAVVFQGALSLSSAFSGPAGGIGRPARRKGKTNSQMIS